MANINREYDGQTKLKEWWKIVRDNADLMNDQTEKHISGEADRHSAEDLDYSGTVEGAATVKEAVETVHTEVSTKQNEWRVTTSGTSTAYTAVLAPAPSEMYVGMRVTIVPHATSTSKNATLNVNGLGAKEIRQRSSNTNIALLAEAKDFLVAGKPAGLMYDGTYWVMTEFSRPAWWDIRSKPDLLQPSNIKAGENVSVSVSGADVTISSEKTPVADNLTSASATTALSAKQGKVLNEKIAEVQTEADGKLDASDLIAGNNVDIAVSGGKVTISAAGGSGGSGGVDIVDNLDSTSKISALSANQGRVLDEKIAEVNSDLESQINAKADIAHGHTSSDISDFPTLQAGENIEVSRDGKVADTSSLMKLNGKYISINGNEIWYKDSADGEAKTVTPDATTTRNYANIAYANGYWLLHDSTNKCMLYSKDFENWYVNTEVSNVSGGIMNSQNCFVALCGDTWRATKPGERVLPTVAGGIDGYTYIKAK